MKIVKFRNGSYGIRKWSFLALDWVFYGMQDWHEDTKENRRLFEMNKEGARAFYKILTTPKPKYVPDSGTPVRKKTRIPPLGVYVPRCRCDCKCKTA
jgi:hypothetical protein